MKVGIPFNMLGIADPPCETFHAPTHPKTPCPCPHFVRCRDERISCQAFQLYVEHGERARGMGERNPSKRWWTNLYGKDVS